MSDLSGDKPTSALPPRGSVQELLQVAAKAEGAAEDRLAKVEDILNRWFNTHVHNSPVSRSVEALRHMRERMANLRDMLVEEL